MKLSIFKRSAILFILVLTASPQLTHSQETFQNTITENLEKQESNKQEKKKKHQTGWGVLLPEYIKVQYAGNMGFLSLGGGWDYGKNKHWETDLFLGFIPKYSTDRNKITFTLKQNYIPWRIAAGEKITFEPLLSGLYLNTVFGNEFWLSEPDKYPSNYYSFSTRLRVNIFAGQRITYKLDSERDYLNAVSIFYEISTSDLYLISAAGNKYLKPKDYLTLSLGIKLQLF